MISPYIDPWLALIYRLIALLLDLPNPGLYTLTTMLSFILLLCLLFVFETMFQVAKAGSGSLCI